MGRNRRVGIRKFQRGFKVRIKGLNVHPGYAKHKMRNACRIAQQFVSMLPRHETPEHTEGYEGFYHLYRHAGHREEPLWTTSYVTTTATVLNAGKGNAAPGQ